MLSSNLFLQKMHLPIVLHINTALNEAYVGLSLGNQLLAKRDNGHSPDFASFLQPAIIELCNETEQPLSSIEAISIINGPGSYTGLRVGLSAAKGICYAMKIPLICLNTLEWLAYGVRIKNPDLVCPMIDARRMEVYTSMYDDKFNCVLEPTAMIINEHSFQESLSKHRIAFVGNGSMKCKSIFNNEHAMFPESKASIEDQIELTFKNQRLKDFSDLAYTEPFYVKEFYKST